MKKIVLVTGGFDPLHRGHIAYLKSAKQLGDILVVGVNSDAWLARKKNQAFMPLLERTAIIQELACVDFVIDFNDNDNTAKHAIIMVRQSYPQDKIIFANGGDRTPDNILEMDTADDNTEFVFGVGGTNKDNSSSWILQEWKAPKTERPWGHYRVLYEVPNTKVKELIVESGRSLSMQRHSNRAEYWHVASGKCMVKNASEECLILDTHNNYFIPRSEWHQLSNPFTDPCKIVEIQYGPDCVEEDIERR